MVTLEQEINIVWFHSHYVYRINWWKLLCCDISISSFYISVRQCSYFSETIYIPLIPKRNTLLVIDLDPTLLNYLFSFSALFLMLLVFLFSCRRTVSLESLEDSVVSGGEDTLEDKHGCPAYVAPEILRAAAYSGRAADMWSLGVMLFTMLIGRWVISLGISYWCVYCNLINRHFCYLKKKKIR